MKKKNMIEIRCHHRWLVLWLAMSFISGLAAAQARSGPKPAPRPRHVGIAPYPIVAADLPTQQEVESFMQRMFGYDPAISWKVLDIRWSEIPNVAEVIVHIGNQPQSLHLFVTPDGQHAVLGEALPFGADPFAPARHILEQKAKGPARGPADAPVTIVEFGDLQCPHCKAAQPILERLMTDEPNTRLVFENFPLDQVHKWASKAAAYDLCVVQQQPAAFWKFVQSVYDNQDNITETNADQKLAELAASAGVDGMKAAACSRTPDTKARVIETQELGKSLGVDSTPTVFINGRKVAGINSAPYESIKALVDYAAKSAEKK